MFYSLSPALMAKYMNLWNFSFLSANTSIDWNIATISRFEKHIDWSALSGNAGITWTEEILDRYKSNFNWQQLSANPAFPVTDKIIEKYTKYLNWIFLSSNPSIPTDDVFLDKYSTKINWSVLKNCNKNINKISQKFQQKLIHLPESRTQSPFPLPDIVSRYIKWNVKAENLSDEFRSLMNERISQVSDFLFEKYKPLWYWRHISACIHLNWSIDFFERFYDDLGSEVTTNVAFYRRAPEPEQITIINFKKAELWAERVRLNKGIVKKLRAGAPPVVLQDDFMARIRQREEELDVVFPNWFVQIMECQQMPEGLEDYEIKTLESLKCYMISEDFPISVKSVVFAEYGTEVLFLALKKDSYYELDDIIYTHEYDQGPPPRIKMRMSLS